MSEMRIILQPNHPPEIKGEWTVGGVLAAAEFLRRWIEQQQIAVQPEAVQNGQ